MDKITYALLRKYIDNSLAGAGAVKGVPCQIQSIESIEGGNEVTFLWEDNEGNTHTSPMDVMNGVKGDKGDKGDTGAKGDKGDKGDTGATGAKGDKGDKGETGLQGVAGPAGAQGVQGSKGDKGDDGYPFLIYKQYDDISEYSSSDFPEIGLMFMVMTYVQDQGYPIYRYTGEGTPDYSLVTYLASEAIKGDKGDKGDTGAQGPQGIQGIQGEKGEKGDKGDKGDMGEQVNSDWEAVSGVAEILHKPTLGTAAAKDSTSSVTSGSTALVESGAVKAAIDEAVSSAYHAAGTKTVAELTSSLLIAANEGNVYNMTDAGTTTSDFIEGSGKSIHIGDNVGVAKVGNDYKFDLLSGFIDTSAFIEKSNTSGLVKNDGTIDTNTYAKTSQLPDITGKADKVASATNGNFAGLDSNGNLTDSGSKASDFASASSVHSVPSGGTAGQVLAKSSDTDYATNWITLKNSRVVELSETNIKTEVGTAKTVTVKYRVAGNSDTATYTSSDTNVATVAVTGHSSTGTSATDVITITPVANGDCTIKIAFANEVGYDAEYDYINVTVGAASSSSKIRYTISSSGWSASANASGYYTYSLTLNPTLKTSYCPTVSIAGSGDSTLWTATEKSNYDLVDYYNNTATNTLVLYAKTKPTGTFYIWVEGEQA